MKKIGAILAKLVCILMTLIMMIGTIVYTITISDAEKKPDGFPVMYENKLYIKEDLVKELKDERMIVIVILAVFLALTVFLFVRSSRKKKKNS